jgi:predicted heme/steroid binding protein
MVRGAQRMASHEFEADRSYSVQITAPLDTSQKFRWEDGQHLLYSSSGKEYITDFDGSNQYELVPSIQKLSGFANKDFDFLYTFKVSDSAIGAPAQLVRSFMRTAEDR